MSAAESESPNGEQEPDVAMIEQFSKLRIIKKDDKMIHLGPNCRYGFLYEHPEIFKAGKPKKESCETCKWSGYGLDDSVLVTTGFPFDVLRADYGLRNMLPTRELCDKLVTRYFECCNSLFNVIDMGAYWGQYSLMWNTPTLPTSSPLAITFFMLAIAARSLNPGHELIPLISSEDQIGVLRVSRMWKQYGQLTLSQLQFLKRSSIATIQALLLLCLSEDEDQERWNTLGLLGSMAKAAGLYRDPDRLDELDNQQRAIRRYILR